MEICKIKISKDLLQILVDSDAIKTSDFELIGVNESQFDYSDSELWAKQKEKCDKEYKKLKNIEFDLRHKQ